MTRTLLLVICGFIAAVFCFVGCSSVQAEANLPNLTNVSKYNDMTFMDFQAKYELAQEEPSLAGDIEVLMKDTTIKFNQTNEQHTEDKEFCNIFYDISFVNKTNKPLNVYAKCFIPNELYTTIVISRNSFGTESRFVNVQPGMKSINTAGCIMKHYDQMSTKEKGLYETFKNDLYILLVYDNAEHFIKVDNLVVVDSKVSE